MYRSEHDAIDNRFDAREPRPDRCRPIADVMGQLMQRYAQPVRSAVVWTPSAAAFIGADASNTLVAGALPVGSAWSQAVA